MAHAILTPLAMQNDPDFELTHFELIKAVKLIAYQVNLVLKRQDYQLDDFQKKVNVQNAELIKKTDKEISRIQGHVLNIQNEVENRLTFMQNRFGTVLS